MVLVAALLLGACAEGRGVISQAPSVLPQGPVSLQESVPPGPSAPVSLGTETRPARPLVVPGTGSFVNPPLDPAPAARTAATAGGDISFNFVNADVREVVREILGNQLGLAYTIDPRLQAAITAQTGAPLPRDAVLPTLESILRASGIALIESGGVYRVVPLDDAARATLGGQPAPGLQRAGYGLRVLPLRFMSAVELKSLLDPFTPPGGVLQADAARNVLIVSGPAADLAGFAELVRQFDVDWLGGKSFALFPLRVGQVRDVAVELQAILDERDDAPGPLSGLVRIVPIERLNAILVIASQPTYVRQMREWIERLDYGEDQTTSRMFEYYVQNSRAVDLAAVLTELLASGQVRTVGAPTAPGAIPAEVGTRDGRGISADGAATTGAPIAPERAGAPTATPSGGAVAPYGTAGSTPALQRPTGQAQRPGARRQRELLRGALADFGPRSAGAGELELPQARVVADEKSNALVIFAKPRDYRMIEGILRKLDIVPLQVLIEATIAEVTLNDALQYGLSYFLQSGNFGVGFTQGVAGVLSPADIAGVFPGFNFVFATGSSRLVLNLLSAVSNINVISSPQLLVLDHQTAALQVGDQVPIVVQSAQSVVNPDSPIVNSIQYRNTGVVLQVTPRVNSSGLVTLDIDQEVSDVSRTTSSNINSPTIAQRRLVSSIVVQDGQTVALGGLIRENQTNAKSGVPGLSDLPLLGWLFGQTTRATGRTELLVLLSPKIVRNVKDAREMTDDLRNRMRALKPLDVRIR